MSCNIYFGHRITFQYKRRFLSFSVISFIDFIQMQKHYNPRNVKVKIKQLSSSFLKFSFAYCLQIRLRFRAGLTTKQNKHVLRASREGGSLFYGLLLFIF